MLWRALARKGRKTRDGGGGNRCGERGRLDMLGVGSLEKQLLVSFGNNDLESSGGAMGGAFPYSNGKITFIPTTAASASQLGQILCGIGTRNCLLQQTESHFCEQMGR